MEKLLKIFLCILFTSVSVMSCSQGNETATQKNKNAELKSSSKEVKNKTGKDSKILIIYYSSSGTTEKVANVIKSKTGADLYLIKTNPPYPTEQEALGKEMALERENGNIRDLSGQLPELSGYDIILIGGPVWSGEPSNPIQKYLSMTNFGGKKVAGFWTAYAEPGDYANKFKKLVNNAKISDGLSFVNTEVSNETVLNSKINTWLNTLGIL